MNLETPPSTTSWRQAANVFLTNTLPRVREMLKVGVDDIRAHNPRIIYVRGTGQGERGPDAAGSVRRATCRAQAPELNERGDALADLGLDWYTVVDLKVRGVVG